MSERAPGMPSDENVLGARTVAAIIDLVVLFALFLAFSIGSGQAESTSSNGEASYQANLTGIPAVVYFLLVFAYYAAPEALFGATLGKKALGLKVTGDSGDATVGQILGRTALRVIDGLPIFYLVGFILAAVRKDHKRLGDIAAGTRVVRAEKQDGGAGW